MKVICRLFFHFYKEFYELFNKLNRAKIQKIKFEKSNLENDFIHDKHKVICSSLKLR